jgi:hypothetical protein
MRKIGASLLVAAVVAGPVLGVAGEAIARTATKTQIISNSMSGGGDSGEPKRQNAVIILSKASDSSDGLANKNVVVKYSKKVDGAWDVRYRHTYTTGGMGLIYADWAPVAKGTCKIVAKFNGTTKFAPSSDSVVINCATGQRI